MRVAPRTARLSAGLLLVGLVAGLVFVGTHDPHEPGTYPPCPTRALLGFLCPGCGALRATHALMHGDLERAWAANPLFVIALPLFLWAVYALLRLAVAGRRPPSPLPSAAQWPAVLVLVTFMFARNT